MRTLQEKYNGVLEGKFSKTQFRRDAATELPQFVSNVNSFDDTVAILKNKGAITEAKKEEKYFEAREVDNIAPDVLDTGIKFELDKKFGTLDVSKEDYEKAKETAVKNLTKDRAHYSKEVGEQLDTPDEKMEKVTLKEDVQNIENDEQTKRRVAGLVNQLLQSVDPRDETVKAYAISVKNDLESGDPSRLSRYKDVVTLDDVKDDMEHYISHDVDQLEEESVEENALGMTDSRLTSKQHSDLDYAVRGDSAYSFGNDPYADDQLRYKYAKKMGFLEEVNEGEWEDKGQSKELNKKRLEDLKAKRAKGGPKGAIAVMDKEIAQLEKLVNEADIKLSAEDMEKLHKDGKITLPNGSVLHFVGKADEEVGMIHDPRGYKKSEPNPKDLVYTKEYKGNGVYDILKNGKKIATVDGEGNANAYINKLKREKTDEEVDATEKAASDKIGRGEEFTDDDAAAVADKMPKIKKDAVFTLMREEEDYKALKEMFKKIITKVIND